MSDTRFTYQDREGEEMSEEAAVGPVTLMTRAVFPQISAHRAPCGLREYEFGRTQTAPASLAVHLRDYHPLPAFVFPQDWFAVKYADSPSGVKCGWGLSGVWYAGSNKVSCSRRTEEG